MEHHLSCVTSQLWLIHSMSSRCKHLHVKIPFESEFRLRTRLQALQGRRGEQLHAAVESEIRHVRIEPFFYPQIWSAFHSELQLCHVCCGACLSLLCHVACAVVALFCVCIQVVRIPLAFRFK